MRYSGGEMETTCIYDYLNDSWLIYSNVTRHMSKLRKIADPFWEERDDGRITAAKWSLNGNQVRFTKEIIVNFTEEQKAEQKLRLQNARQKLNDIIEK